MKDCDRIAPELLFRADGAAAGPALEEHLRGCEPCASRERDARARIALLRGLPVRKAPEALDRAVLAEIAALARDPAEARGRLVARWLGRLARLSVPGALDGRVRAEIEGARHPSRGRLLRLGAAASAAAAGLAVAWTLLFSGSEILPDRSLAVRDVGPEEIRNEAARELAARLGAEGALALGVPAVPPAPNGERQGARR